MIAETEYVPVVEKSRQETFENAICKLPKQKQGGMSEEAAYCTEQQLAVQKRQFEMLHKVPNWLT